MEFKVGNIVEVNGVIGKIEYIDHLRVRPIFVTFNEGEHSDEFYINGKYRKWHKEPSLKLIQQPKKKVKKYKALYKTDSELILSNEYFTDKYEAINAMDVRWCYLQLLESTMIEVEE